MLTVVFVFGPHTEETLHHQASHNKTQYMDQQLLNLLTNLGFQDFQCNKIVFGDIVPEESKPGEREFLQLLHDVLQQVRKNDVVAYLSTCPALRLSGLMI